MVRIPSNPPDDELDPQQLHDRVDDAINLSLGELQAFRDSELNQAYLEANSEKAQPGDQPLDDVIRLVDTPRSEYSDADDGFNEAEESRELLDFQRRTQGQIKSQGLGSNTIDGFPDATFREVASIRWGIDPDDDREWL